MSLVEMFSTPWARVTLEQGGRLVRLVRTTERMTLEGIVDLERQLGVYLPMTNRKRLRLLIDARPSPMLSGDDVERQIMPGLQRLHDGFERSAVLVNTAVGRLQANRVRRDEGVLTRVLVNDESEAVAFLLR